MTNVTFAVVPTNNHVFISYSCEEGPVYFMDSELKQVVDFSKVDISRCICTQIPDKLQRIEMSKSCGGKSISETLNYHDLWPYSNIAKAEVIVDGKDCYSFDLYSENQKIAYREKMESMNWNSHVLIVYTKNVGKKIGFLLFAEE